MRECKIEGCGKPIHARGWCDIHYRRWMSHGDPFGGRTFIGEPERFYREAVLTCERGPDDPCLIWPYNQNGAGYARMTLDGEECLVSRLACKDVHGEPPTAKHEAAHSCGKGHLRCVTRGHLSWKTQVGNSADKLIHGTHNRGERHGIAKLTETDVREIRSLKGRLPQQAIAAKFGVARSNVSLIQSGKRWSWLGGAP